MNILFFCELFPDVVHGVSIANRLNVDLLSKSASVDMIQEKTQIDFVGKTSLGKIKNLLASIFSIRQQSRADTYQAFYIVISLSLFGMLKTLLAIYAFSSKSRSEIIVHLHRGDFVKFYHRRWIHRVLIKLCFGRVSRLIVLSESQKQEMSNFFPNKSIFVVENAVLEERDLPRYPAKTIFSNRFIFISNYLKEKGIYDLLTAFASLDDLELNCYGAFHHNVAEIKALQRNGLVVNPPIGGKEKFNAIHEADALILPSWNEGQPTIILEAMMVGTPVLTTRVGLIGELLGDDYPFYFEPQNPHSLIDCIHRFQSYIDKASLSVALQQRYFEQFSLSNHQQKLLKAFGLNEVNE